MRTLFILISLFVCVLAKSQDFDNYLPMKSSGVIPEEFITLSQSKYYENIESVKNEKSRMLRNSKKSFLLNDAYFIDFILQSGLVYFNDPISQYASSVCDVLLKNDKELRSKIRIYTLRSSEVNSFCTNRGIIFITTGLMAQLENEAQLAYILSHEIVHFKNNHVMESFVNDLLINRGKNKYTGLDYQEKIFASKSYSKELEAEADSIGYEFFKNTSYDYKQAEKVCDILLYSYLPIDEIVFDSNFFQSATFKFPKNYWLENVKEISPSEDYDDSWTTHPNIRKRRDAIIRQIENTSSTHGAEKFIVSEEKFRTVIKMARYELASIYLSDLDFINGLYCSYVLLKENPNSRYLQTNIGFALYALSLYKADGSISEVTEEYKNKEGEIQQLYYFISKLKNKEMTALALRYIWPVYKANPNDVLLKLMTEQTFKTLFGVNKIKSSFFLKNVPVNDSLTTSQTTENLSKYEKIKAKESKTKPGNESFAAFAFIDLFTTDPEFTAQYTAFSKKYSDFEEEDPSTAYHQSLKARKNQKYRGARLGIDTLIVLNPQYIKLDERKKNKMRFIDAEKGQQDLIDRMKTQADNVNLEMNLLCLNQLSQSAVDQYNDYSLLKRWLLEYNTQESVVVLPRNYQQVAHIINNYHTRYLGVVYAGSIREKKRGVVGMILLGLIPYATPFSLIYLLKQEYTTAYTMKIIDINKGQEVFDQSFVVRNKESNDLMNSIVYCTMKQIKTKKK